MSIEGKVAAILNERELVINRGAETGVKENMKFKVMAPELVVADPDTGGRLGTFSREKVRVKIAEVHPKYSVARTYETYKVNVGGSGLPTVYFERLLPRQEVTRVRTLRPDDTATFGPIDEASSIVKIGDPVVQVEDDVSA